MSEEQRMREQLERENRDRQMIERALRERIKNYERAMQRERQQARDEAERAWRERSGA